MDAPEDEFEYPGESADEVMHRMRMRLTRLMYRRFEDSNTNLAEQLFLAFRAMAGFAVMLFIFFLIIGMITGKLKKPRWLDAVSVPAERTGAGTPGAAPKQKKS